MQITTPAAIALALLLGFGTAGAAEESFEANYAKANANAATLAGAIYDAALGASYEAMPDFKPKVDACLQESPAPHVVRGYFLFQTKQSFGVFLEPKDDFTLCLSKALASASLPPPPSAPYLNPFTFTLQP